MGRLQNAQNSATGFVLYRHVNIAKVIRLSRSYEERLNQLRVDVLNFCQIFSRKCSYWRASWNSLKLMNTGQKQFSLAGST